MDVEKLLMMTTTNVRANWLQELFKIIKIVYIKIYELYKLSEHDEGHLCDCLPEYFVLILIPTGRFT